MAITSRRISGPREVFAKPLLTVLQCRLSACAVSYRPIAPDPRCLQIGRQRSGKRKRPSQLRSGADDNPNSQSASPIDGSRRTVIVGTSALNRSGHGAATVTGKPALNGTTHPSDGELTMKKIILTAAAFASLAAIEVRTCRRVWLQDAIRRWPNCLGLQFADGRHHDRSSPMRAATGVQSAVHLPLTTGSCGRPCAGRR